MRVAVVTPFHRCNPDHLARCHASVRAQTHPATHILVSDGAGPPPLSGFSGQTLLLGQNHADWGDTPRALGLLSAAAQGYDAVALLDDDNWFEPEHLATVVALARSSGAALCSARRNAHDASGAFLAACEDPPDWADTSCTFLTRAAFGLASEWSLMPAEFHVVGDRWIWRQAQRRSLSIARSPRHTVAYRSRYAQDYRLTGRPPPPDAYSADTLARLVAAAQKLERVLPRAG